MGSLLLMDPIYTIPRCTAYTRIMCAVVVLRVPAVIDRRCRRRRRRRRANTQYRIIILSYYMGTRVIAAAGRQLCARRIL